MSAPIARRVSVVCSCCGERRRVWQVGQGLWWVCAVCGRCQLVASAERPPSAQLELRLY